MTEQGMAAEQRLRGLEHRLDFELARSGRLHRASTGLATGVALLLVSLTAAWSTPTQVDPDDLLSDVPWESGGSGGYLLAWSLTNLGEPFAVEIALALLVTVTTLVLGVLAFLLPRRGPAAAAVTAASATLFALVLYIGQLALDPTVEAGAAFLVSVPGAIAMIVGGAYRHRYLGQAFPARAKA